MSKHLVILRCSRTTATVTIIASICLFVLIGCASLFRSAGLTDEQALAQESKFRAALATATSQAVVDIQAGIAEGQALKTIAVKTASAFLWKIIAAAGATVGVVLNGLLAKWLGTEKKITKALITGIESTTDVPTKRAVKENALAAGVEPQLYARVKNLTKA